MLLVFPIGLLKVYTSRKFGLVNTYVMQAHTSIPLSIQFDWVHFTWDAHMLLSECKLDQYWFTFPMLVDVKPLQWNVLSITCRSTFGLHSCAVDSPGDICVAYKSWRMTEKLWLTMQSSVTLFFEKYILNIHKDKQNIWITGVEIFTTGRQVTPSKEQDRRGSYVIDSVFLQWFVWCTEIWLDLNLILHLFVFGFQCKRRQITEARDLTH